MTTGSWGRLLWCQVSIQEAVNQIIGNRGISTSRGWWSPGSRASGPKTHIQFSGPTNCPGESSSFKPRMPSVPHTAPRAPGSYPWSHGSPDWSSCCFSVMCPEPSQHEREWDLDLHEQRPAKSLRVDDDAKKIEYQDTRCLCVINDLEFNTPDFSLIFCPSYQGVLATFQRGLKLRLDTYKSRLTRYSTSYTIAHLERRIFRL